MWVLIFMATLISQAIQPLEKLLADGRPRSRLEVLAIRRQISDLKTGHKRGLVWDVDEAEKAMSFARMLSHWKGKWARRNRGEPMSVTRIKWEPWQEHMIWRPLFGWYRNATREEGGKRRFKVGWIEIPRKNSKTTMAAGIALKGLVADEERGAQVYAAATRKDQAAILLKDAKGMITGNSELGRRTTRFKDSIVCNHWASKLTTLPSDPSKLDGFDVHFGVVDEVHEHKDRGVWDVLLGGTIAREHPLQLGITTAGSNRGTPDDPTIGWELHEYARHVLEGWETRDFIDETFFAFICSAEEGDDPLSPKTWAKANPNWNVSVDSDNVASIAQKSRLTPSAMSNFKRKHLNIWVSAHHRAIKIELWDACRGEIGELTKESECFVATDLGFRNDLAARIALFPVYKFNAERRELASVRLLCKQWMPESGRRDITKEPWATWIKHGHIIVTKGCSTDIGAIYHDIVECDRRWLVRDVSLDPHNALQLGQQLLEYAEGQGKPEDPAWVCEFRQNMGNYTEPCKELESIIADGRIVHDGNPVLRWNMDNLVFRRGENEGVMPSKKHSADKIDGCSATLMALARAMFSPPAANGAGAFLLG